MLVTITTGGAHKHFEGLLGLFGGFLVLTMNVKAFGRDFGILI